MQQTFSHKILFYMTFGAAVILLAISVIALLFVLMQQADQQNLSSVNEPKTVGIVQFLGILEPSIQGFKDTMVTYGYREGENITYLQNSANGNLEQLAQIAQGYINQNVDLIFAESPESGFMALQAT